MREQKKVLEKYFFLPSSGNLTPSNNSKLNYYNFFFFNSQVYGSGKQTRSFQYVSDLVDGLIALMNSNYSLPVNLGNPTEHTITGL